MLLSLFCEEQTSSKSFGPSTQEAIKLLSHYRDELLPQKMKENNGIYKKYNIEWIGREGLSPETHEEYLNDFINHIYKNLLKLVRGRS